MGKLRHSKVKEHVLAHRAEARLQTPSVEINSYQKEGLQTLGCWQVDGEKAERSRGNREEMLHTHTQEKSE